MAERWETCFPVAMLTTIHPKIVQGESTSLSPVEANSRVAMWKEFLESFGKGASFMTR